MVITQLLPLGGHVVGLAGSTLLGATPDTPICSTTAASGDACSIWNGMVNGRCLDDVGNAVSPAQLPAALVVEHVPPQEVALTRFAIKFSE